MTAIDNLTASVTALNSSVKDLTEAVDTAVIDITVPGATDAQLLTLQGVVDTVKAGLDAQTARLNAATAPITPPPAA